MRVSAGM